jgi:hypothetical protein
MTTTLLEHLTFGHLVSGQAEFSIDLERLEHEAARVRAHGCNHAELPSPATKTNWRQPLNVTCKALVSKAVPRTRFFVRRRFSTTGRRVLPTTHCLDFEERIRTRDDPRGVIQESIRDLKRQGIVDGIDIDGIWRRHQARRADRGDGIALLASLEINLKVRPEWFERNSQALVEASMSQRVSPIEESSELSIWHHGSAAATRSSDCVRTSSVEAAIRESH